MQGPGVFFNGDSGNWIRQRYRHTIERSYAMHGRRKRRLSDSRSPGVKA